MKEVHFQELKATSAKLVYHGVSSLFELPYANIVSVEITKSDEHESVSSEFCRQLVMSVHC